jgi:hypothetical protein
LPESHDKYGGVVNALVGISHILSHYFYHDSEGANDHQEVHEEIAQVLEYGHKHLNEETQSGNDPDQLTEFQEDTNSDRYLQRLDCIELGRVGE